MLDFSMLMLQPTKLPTPTGDVRVPIEAQVVMMIPNKCSTCRLRNGVWGYILPFQGTTLRSMERMRRSKR